MLGSVQGAFKVPTLHFSGLRLFFDSFAHLLIPLTPVLRNWIPFKRLLPSEYQVLVDSLRGSIRRAPS